MPTSIEIHPLVTRAAQRIVLAIGPTIVDHPMWIPAQISVTKWLEFGGNSQNIVDVLTYALWHKAMEI